MIIDRPPRHLDTLTPSERKNAELMGQTMRAGPTCHQGGKPIRWHITVRKTADSDSIPVYPLRVTEAQARARALEIYPDYEIISVEHWHP